APRAALPLLPATTGGSVRKEEEAGGGGRRKGRGGGGAGPRAQSSAFLAARPASAEAASSKTGRPPGRSPGFASRACGASRSSRATSSAVRLSLAGRAEAPGGGRSQGERKGGMAKGRLAKRISSRSGFVPAPPSAGRRLCSRHTEDWARRRGRNQ
ncbi:unnamed protein product, partial [Prorocentrum cordatum]